jgi:hypothetical protein
MDGHLKEQEKLSRKTLEELLQKQVQLSQVLSDIETKFPLVKKQRE